MKNISIMWNIRLLPSLISSKRPHWRANIILRAGGRAARPIVLVVYIGRHHRRGPSGEAIKLLKVPNGP